MATLTESRHAGGFIVSEGNGFISREAVTVLSGQVLGAGAVVGRIETAGATAVAGTNTGNGVMGAITVGAGVQEGVYTLRVIEVVANAGNFEVVDPQGDVIGLGSVAVAFANGGLAFTLADGATDFIVGDGFAITVAAGSKKYVAHDAAATDGSQRARAILFDAVDATLADAAGLTLARYAEVNADEIVWKTGISAPNKAAGIESLAGYGIIVR